MRMEDSSLSFGVYITSKFEATFKIEISNLAIILLTDGIINNKIISSRPDS